MMKRILALMSLLAVCLPVGAAKKTNSKAADGPVTVRIASYSIYAPKHRAQNVSGKPEVPTSRYWSISAPALAEQIKDLNCDVMGLQAVDDTVVGLASSETLESFLKKAGAGYYKLEAMSNKYPDNPYGAITWTTNGLLYRSDRLKLVDSGIIWLAGNRYAPERGEGCTFPQISLDRTCIWGRFKEKASGKEFYVLSSELNGFSFRHKGKQITDSGPNMYNVREINKFVKEVILPEGIPVFLAADILNADGYAKNKTFKKFCEMWKDSRFAAEAAGLLTEYEKQNVSTMNEQDGSVPRTYLHRDNVFFINAKIKSYKVDRRRFRTASGSMMYPANHFPIVADFELK